MTQDERLDIAARWRNIAEQGVDAKTPMGRRAIFTTDAPPDMPSVLGLEHGVRWIVFISREGGQAPTTVGLFSEREDAATFYGNEGANWSDSYLCEVVRGPHDGRLPAPTPGAVLTAELFGGAAEVPALRARVAELRRKVASYDGGDRPMSPPVKLLRELADLEQALREHPDARPA